VSIDPSPQDMKAIVANAVEQARPLVEAQRHQLTLEVALAPAMVSGDAKRLVQVVSNLLNNAAKYTPPGGRIQVIVEADATVRVHVKDNGIGIPKSLQPRIFELFAQAERTPDRSQGGLGLGLALVRSLVELHGGSVSCSSDGAGQGSCFTVTLPRLERGRAAEAAGADAGAAGGAAPLDVLVVDDNTDAAAMLQLLLEGAGHRVRVEHDPVHALTEAIAAPPEVGLIDIGLPQMDGYELVRRLRAVPATAAALYVAVTGYGQEKDRARALAAGFDEHLVKPVDPGRLLALLARAKAN
jgi:CheY-like chemotaxis protein